jgi:hypothetical protein
MSGPAVSNDSERMVRPKSIQDKINNVRMRANSSKKSLFGGIVKRHKTPILDRKVPRENSFYFG